MTETLLVLTSMEVTHVPAMKALKETDRLVTVQMRLSMNVLTVRIFLFKSFKDFISSIEIIIKNSLRTS